jgi:hypothetical protein
MKNGSNGLTALLGKVLTALLALLFVVHHAREIGKAETKLFSGSQMTDVKLKGVRVRLGQPIQVTESHGYAYIPTIAKFPSGELIITYSLVADTNENPAYVGAFQISSDGGKTWGQRYDVLPEHQPMIYVPQEAGSLIAIPAQLYPKKPGDLHNFQAAYIRFEQGGRRMIMEPQGVQVVDWPFPLKESVRVTPGKPRNYKPPGYVRMAFDGNA